MGVTSRKAWVGLWMCAWLTTVATAVRADDFDDDFADDFAEQPAPAPQQPAPTPAQPADPFEDDFAEPESPPDQAPAPADPFEEDAEQTAPATEAAESTPEGERRVDCAIVDAVEAREAQIDPKERERRERALRTRSTMRGPTGGVHVVDAGGGAQKSFRFALGTQFFRKDGFLVADDEASRVGGTLAFAITPRPYLEIAASVVAYATANAQEDPSLFQVLGDMRVFGRGFHRVLPWLTVGGDLELAFLNGVGGIGLSGKGTSVGLRASASADLRELDRTPDLPLIFRTNLRYYFDNSAKLIRDVESARYANLATPFPPQDETRHLVTNVERYAFTINRVDSLSMAFGFEAPVNVKDDYYLHPLLEWSFDIPVNRQGYDCVFRPSDPGERDGCLAEEGFGARISTLTVGARFIPPVKGLSVMTAFDIGTTGSRTTVRELSPNAPWMWWTGLTYTYDLQPEPPEVYTRTITVTPEAEPVIEGRVTGTVVETDTQQPIPGAAVRFEDTERSALLTGDDGTFTSYRFPPGPVSMQLRAPDHQPGSCEATLPEDGSDVQVTCTLQAQKTHGDVRVVLRDQSGGASAGTTVRLTGAGETRAAVTDSQGEAVLQELPVGSYDVSAEPKDFLARRSSVSVRARETARVDFSLTQKPGRSALRSNGRRLVPRRNVQFKGESDQVDSDSHVVLAEVADFMIRHPDVRTLEVQRHEDNTGGPAAAQQRSQRRAEAIRGWLVDAGVESSRLKAVGHGAKHPVVPNITPSNRARNRRVVFEIVERD